MQLWKALSNCEASLGSRDIQEVAAADYSEISVFQQAEEGMKGGRERDDAWASWQEAISSLEPPLCRSHSEPRMIWTNH